MQDSPDQELFEFDFGMLEMLDVVDVQVPEELEAPPIQDPRWFDRTRRLHAFLTKPKSWVELEGWAARERVGHDEVRNQLVVLEQMGQAETNGKGLRLTWRAKSPFVRKRGAA
jgi:hypothetical protein